MQKIKINSASGITLDGTLITPQRCQPTGKSVLLVHGWMGNEDSQFCRVEPLAELGYTCLTFSLPGHGNSEGNIETLTRQDFLGGVIAAYDYLKSQKDVNPDEIAVASASFGCYLASLLTEKRPVSSLILRAPANYPDKGFEQVPLLTYINEDKSIATWRQKSLTYNQTAALKAIHHYAGKILIVESGNDTVIPHQTVQNYMDAASDKAKVTHITIPGADHNLSDDNHLHQFIQILVDWFR